MQEKEANTENPEEEGAGIENDIVDKGKLFDSVTALQNAISRKISLESDQSSEQDREDASHGSTTSLCDSIYNPNDPVSNLIILWESKQTN